MRGTTAFILEILKLTQNKPRAVVITVRQIGINIVQQIFRQNISTDLHVRQIYSLIFRSTDLQIGQTERANLLNKSINGRRRLM